jgi:hypothetical protein
MTKFHKSFALSKLFQVTHFMISKTIKKPKDGEKKYMEKLHQ